MTMTATGSPVASFREAGAGVGVVCLHASASSSTQWPPLMDRLASRFHVLAVDLYGSGRSPRWPDERPLSLLDETALIEPVLAGAGERFHLVGHSYGGAGALRAALAPPGRRGAGRPFEPPPFSFPLCAGPPPPAARGNVAVRDETVGALERGRPDLAGAEFVDYWMGAGTWASMPEPRRAGIATAMRSVRAQWNAVFMEPAPLSAFATLEVPILYI